MKKNILRIILSAILLVLPLLGCTSNTSNLGFDTDFSTMITHWASSSFHIDLGLRAVVIRHSEQGISVTSRLGCESRERLNKLNSLLPESERISWESFLINPAVAFEAYLSLSVTEGGILSRFSPGIEGRE